MAHCFPSSSAMGKETANFDRIPTAARDVRRRRWHAWSRQSKLRGTSHRPRLRVAARATTRAARPLHLHRMARAEGHRDELDQVLGIGIADGYDHLRHVIALLRGHFLARPSCRAERTRSPHLHSILAGINLDMVGED